MAGEAMPGGGFEAEAVLLGHQRHCVRADLSQAVDEVGLRRLPERELVDLPDRGDVFGSLGPDRDHVLMKRDAQADVEHILLPATDESATSASIQVTGLPKVEVGYGRQ